MSDTTPNPRPKLLIASVILLLLLVGGVAALSASTTPGLNWNQQSPAPTVIAGSAPTTTTISFTATGKLPDAVVQLSPSLAGLVSVSPTNLGTVYQGQTVTLTLTTSAPATSTPTVVQGSIQIQKQQNPPLQVYGSPLQVSLNVKWPSFTDPSHSYTINYPPLLTSSYNATYNSLLLEPSSAIPDTESPGIVVSQEANPQNLTVQEFFDGDNGPDLVDQSLGIYSTSTLPSGATAYQFDPVVTSAGGVIVVVPGAQKFLIIQDQSGGHGSEINQLLNSLTLY